MIEHLKGPFELLSQRFADHPSPIFIALDTFVYGVVGLFSMFGFFILGLFVLPAILNKKFDTVFLKNSSGTFWLFKSAAFPGSHYYRARDYARAAVSEKRAQKIFRTPSSVFRAQLSPFVVFLCRALIACEWTFGFILLLTVFRECLLK